MSVFAELLEVAIDGKGSLRRFKDDGIQERALEWLGYIDMSLIEE